jgi:hypothetical protein
VKGSRANLGSIFHIADLISQAQHAKIGSIPFGKFQVSMQIYGAPKFLNANFRSPPFF